MKRIMLFLLLAGCVSAIEDCELVDRVPLGVDCNIITFSVNASNISQFYTGATCTIDYFNTSGDLSIDDGAMDDNSDGSYNYSVSSNFNGFAYYKVTCVIGADSGSSTGSLNFGLDDLSYLAEINTSVSEINTTLGLVSTNLIEVNSTLTDVNNTLTVVSTNLGEVNDSIAWINDTLDDMNMSLASINESLDSLESQATNRNSILGQALQVLEDIYGVIWSGANVTERYHILVDDNTTFNYPEINRRTADSNLTLEQERHLTNGTTYYWKVRVVEGGGYGLWSDIREFVAAFD